MKTIEKIGRFFGIRSKGNEKWDLKETYEKVLLFFNIFCKWIAVSFVVGVIFLQSFYC